MIVVDLTGQKKANSKNQITSQMIAFDFTGQKKANSKNKKNQIKRNAAKKMPTNSFGDTLFDKIYQIMEKHKEVI